MQTDQLLTIYERLEEAYGEPHLVPDGDPLGGLVGTILSQSTSDINSRRAYHDLREAIPSWETVRDMPAEQLAETIKRGGLSNIKAARIQSALRALSALLPTTAADEDLDARFQRWIAALPVADARLKLQQLPGVGPKTAACVLLFSLGLPSMPVDTHVYRVSQRLGLFPARTNLARAHAAYDEATPEALVYPLHVLLITHGRRTCRAQHPRCTDCPLLDICPTGQALIYGVENAV